MSGRAQIIAKGFEVPEQRPKCPGCGEPRKPWFFSCDKDGDTRSNAVLSRTTHKRFYGWAGYGHFCTLRCATKWANAQIELRRAHG